MVLWQWMDWIRSIGDRRIEMNEKVWLLAAHYGEDP